MLKLPKSISDLRIKIFTRSFSLEMYELAKATFLPLGVSCVRLTDQMADGYFFTILKDKDCDIAINIDEDAYLVDLQATFDLVAYVVENGYANAGCPDGSDEIPRDANPIITNPFFNIFDLRLIRSKEINKKEISAFNYLSVKEQMVANFPQEINIGTKFNFGDFDREPYYPFFFWLAYHFKTYYLPAKCHKDGISTILFNHQGKEICYHSWFSRFYNIDAKQTKRINALIDEAYQLGGIDRKSFIATDRIRFWADYILRWIIKIPMRMANWPNKWKKWYIRYQVKKEKSV